MARSSSRIGVSELARRPARLSRADRKAWAERYAGADYRELPWFSPRPYPWVREVAASGQWPKRTRLLDVGCGAGTNVLYLARKGFRAEGVDVAPGAVSAASLRAARLGLSATFQVADALDLPFPARSFGGATDVGCFHTLPVTLRTGYARELARVLRPRGLFCLACVAREYTGEFGPTHRLSVEEIVAVFEKDFQVLEIGFRRPGGQRGRGRRGGAIPAYDVLLERRRKPQPAPR